MAKFARLAETLISDGITAGGEFHEPPAPCRREWLELVHERGYVGQVLSGVVRS
jgi:hypothetical protein